MKRLLAILLLAAWLSSCATTRKPSLAVVTGALAGLVVWHVYFAPDDD